MSGAPIVSRSLKVCVRQIQVHGAASEYIQGDGPKQDFQLHDRFLIRVVSLLLIDSNRRAKSEKAHTAPHKSTDG